MGDPLTAWAATGAASSFIQIIDFTFKLVKESSELMRSTDNALNQNKLVEKFSRLHEQLADQVLDTNIPKRPLSENEKVAHSLASECKDTSRDLLKLLKDLKVDPNLKGLGRAWQSTRKAAKALGQRQAIEIKQEYLCRMNGQLSTALLLHLRDCQLSLRSDLFDHVEHARSKNASLIVESREAILKALDGHERKRKCIINSLRFPGMHARRNTIPHARHNTFSWVLDQPSPLRRFLASRNAIFWVTGKAGSGKSTFMKFVANHPRTREELLKWAGTPDDGLLIVQNYMWHPGVAMQRNEQGLLQGILFHIVHSNPELAELVSSRWNEDILDLREQDPWSKEDLKEELANVFEKSCNWARYCLFIDGLDEYEGEHSELLATVMAFSKHSNVKIVVSSRGWNVFRNVFEHLDEKIYLHNLTHKDIHRYVRGELRPFLETNPMAEELISNIVEKAMGVFFWVFLVVRSVREGFEEGDSIVILRERVEALPSDLEEYFMLDLKRISPVYRKRTFRAFKLAELTIGQDAPYTIHDPLSFIRFWILSEELLDNERFAFDLGINYPDQYHLNAMYAKTRRFLSACCKDFLHLKPLQEDLPTEFGQVEFLHRTVHDFLTSEQIRHLIDKNVPAHFKHVLFPLQMALARLKVVTTRSFALWQNTIEAIMNNSSRLEDSDQTRELVAEYEKAAICYFARMPDYDLHVVDNDFLVVPGIVLEATVIRCVAAFFVSYQRHSFIEIIFTVDPSLVRANIPHTCSILAPTLGLSSNHPFSISKVSQDCLRLLLRNGAAANPEEVRTWHAVLIQAMKDHISWSANERDSATKIVEQLLCFGVDMQSGVRLLPNTCLPTADHIRRIVDPKDILTAVFSKSQVDVMLYSRGPSADDLTVVNEEYDNGYETPEIKSATTSIPRYEATVEVLRLGWQ